MPIFDPRDLNDRYNEMFRAGDIDDMVSLYEEDAILCPAPGQEITGRAAIRQRISSLVALKGELSASEQSCVVFENLALLHARWSFVGTSADGTAIRLSGASSKIARRGSDGAWHYVLDMPAGPRA